MFGKHTNGTIKLDSGCLSNSVLSLSDFVADQKTSSHQRSLKTLRIKSSPGVVVVVVVVVVVAVVVVVVVVVVVAVVVVID